MNIKDVAIGIERVREEKPLVHNMTNQVVTNFTANGLLSLGASPVMANAREEVADMVKIAAALVLNIGTLTLESVESMIIAGKAANEQGVPVIFDPVGAGATPFRTNSAKRIMDEVMVSVVRGNASEIANMLGEENWVIKGVDAGEENGDKLVLAKKAAEAWRTTVVITGAEDIITDGKRLYTAHNGHQLLTKVTGTGCLLTSVIGAFCAIEKDFCQAALSAVVYYGCAAERAAERTEHQGPGSFQIEFLNQLAAVNAESIKQSGLIEEVK
ncbi:hydroxyethylthiazole kinase [Bacillus sp. CLL-7-23]|uniref:Hydroxyethylthiazole kinase n=1 Tax=Bacillus changyiensis TaxID=3004103 RepID=A0ABT4WZ09_9BACI|nr:hydroxyethylthiazole kinase [Bacillus changyiensis]MDA7025288.1 hydroxyethylthiazole kinase [Bacillus changyiensis]